MKVQLGIRLDPVLNEEIDDIVERLRADIEVGTVTKTEVVTLLLEKGVQQWMRERFPCKHKNTVELIQFNVDGEYGLHEPSWVVCPACERVVGGVE